MRLMAGVLCAFIAIAGCHVFTPDHKHRERPGLHKKGTIEKTRSSERQGGTIKHKASLKFPESPSTTEASSDLEQKIIEQKKSLEH